MPGWHRYAAASIAAPGVTAVASMALAVRSRLGVVPAAAADERVPFELFVHSFPDARLTELQRRIATP